jgi:hypothetical protein
MKQYNPVIVKEGINDKYLSDLPGIFEKMGVEHETI